MRVALSSAAAIAFCLSLGAQPAIAATTEFCLDGEFDLGLRLQGMTPAAGEFVEARFCVITEDGSDRVQFHGAGQSNPDIYGEFIVSFLPPDTVRIVNRDSPPDIEFRPAGIGSEAANYRRLDPRRLVAALETDPDWSGPGPGDGWRIVRYPGAARVVAVQVVDGRLAAARTQADLPLRGTVPVIWAWDWSAGGSPVALLTVDGKLLFRGRGAWRTLDDTEASGVWARSGGMAPREVAGDAWPARIDMRLETLDEGVYLVRGVRTGFQHLVIDTGSGLVVADAPAGWVELQQVPPADLVPGLGVSGLSERFVDFLSEALPGRPIRAVALTHHHDDHAGGARAFAAAGADVYAPAAVASFLETALNRQTMPDDRFAERERHLTVRPVADTLTLGSGSHAVEFVSIGANPHAAAMLGVYAPQAGYFFQSDLHVPVSDTPAPRPERAATECWFAAWAVARLPPDTVVVGSHGSAATPVSRLAKYLQHERCR